MRKPNARHAGSCGQSVFEFAATLCKYSVLTEILEPAAKLDSGFLIGRVWRRSYQPKSEILSWRRF